MSKENLTVNEKFLGVVYTGQLTRTIKDYSEIKFSEQELDGLVSKIQLANVTNKETKKEHVNHVNTKVRMNDLKVSQDISSHCFCRDKA